KKIQTPEVRELVWALASPALLYYNPERGRYHFLTQDWYTEQFELHQDWILELDEDPEPLLNHLHSEGKQLLGKRFEKLISFWLQNSPHFDLLLQGQQLFEDKITKGEVDFLFKEKATGESFHLEVACKFYLSKNNSGQWKDFIGPNGKDTLALKMEKIHAQLDLLKTSIGQEFLKDQGLPTSLPILMLKGVLFYHYQDILKAKPPKWHSPHYQTGWWMKASEWGAMNSKHNQWIILEKQQWLTMVHEELEESNVLTGDELGEVIHRHFKQKNNRSLAVAQIVNTGYCLDEVSRGFIVNNTWPL
ncbi:MAG: DUF1853 family protein, partial [Bacteroidota bacterium]